MISRGADSADFKADFCFVAVRRGLVECTLEKAGRSGECVPLWILDTCSVSDKTPYF